MLFRSLLLDLHEDKSKKGFYLYASIHTEKLLIIKAKKVASQFFEPLQQSTIYKNKLNDGVVIEPPSKHPKTLDGYAFRNGIPYITLEAPGKHPLSKRTDFFVAALNAIIPLVRSRGLEPPRGVIPYGSEP